MGKIQELASAIDERMNGERIDKALALIFPGLGRRRIRRLIEAGAVYLNGTRCGKLSKLTKTGDKIKILEKEESVTASQNIDELEVVYDDGGLIAVNKPPLLSSAPTKTTLRSAQLVVAGFKNLKFKDVHAINRLDLPVSGVLLFSIGADVTRELEKLKAEGQVKKYYLAWVKGFLEENEGSMDFPISSENGASYVRNDGKESMTYFNVLKRKNGFSLLEVSPVTGRMHQIRLHLKEKGFPIVGDRKYGGPPYLAKRPLLHCKRISFFLKEKGKIEIKAPVAEDFAEFEEKIRGIK